MEKLGCFIGILLFICVTALVMFTDAGKVEHTVNFSNQNLAINQQKETDLHGVTPAINNTVPQINNKKISSNNINFDIETKELNNSDINYSNQDISYNNQNSSSNNSSFNHKGFVKQNNSVNNYNSLNNYGTKFQNNGSLSNSGRFNNRGTLNSNQSEINKLKTGLKPSNRYSSKHVNYNNSNPSVNQYNPDSRGDAYTLKNIDWRIWRSNFVNRITDDTFYIPELSNYPNGTMFYYSFTVDSTGRVYNVKVSSITISRSDREKIADLIRSYSYKEITRFPANSKRKTANISAILIFSTETEYSSPEDFHDLEQIKMKL